MAINHVVKLLNTIEYDSELRNKLYKCSNQSELTAFLNSKGYYISNDDIENAINVMHVQCQTLDEAQALLHKADWLRFLITGI
jgi:hypothetical protein